ncbi:MAG: hypothetical protein GXP48_05125, partial [Acidobacteria bacterium]|nr:hypothetical protein [Acidobacteriota bacterium]
MAWHRVPGARKILGPAAVAGMAFAAGVAIRHGARVGPASYVLGWIWGLVLLFAMIGWGRLLNRTLLAGRALGWGMRAALGLALTVIVGGVLNLAGVISPGAVLAYLAIGIGLVCWRARFSPGAPRRAWRRLAGDPALIVGLILVAGFALIQYSSSVAGTIDTANARPAFDMHDDVEAYLVFPEKMLETGSIGREPFEARRVLSLGGQSFLDTMVLAARPVRALHLVDEGVALLVLLGLVLGAGRRLHLGPRLGILVLLLVLAMPHLPMRGNTSALLTGVALLLAWFLLEMERSGDAPGRRFGEWVLLALPAAAACAVKSTFIPFAVPFFLLLTLADLASRGDRRRAIIEAGTTAGLIVAFVSPWMLSAYLSSGTPLYPVLGRGFLGAASNHGFPAVKGHFQLAAVDVIRAAWKHVFVLWPVAFLLVFVTDHRRRRPVIALGAASAAAAILYVLLGDPNLNHSLTRYVFPMLMLSLTGVELAVLEGAERLREHGLRLAAIAGVAVAAVFFMGAAAQARGMGDQMLVNIGRGVVGRPFVSQRERTTIEKLQRALPPKATVLATLRTPFLLDFARNRVLIMSLPGFSSPPPGLPIDGGAGGAVSRYLLAHGVRFIAYGGVRSVHDLLELTAFDIRARYPRSKMRWAMLTYHELFRKIILELAVSRKVLYADGRRVVLDLATRDHAVVPGAVPGRRGF